MITFPCTCGYAFNVLDAEAGDDLQCPNCGKLVSVPTPGDLMGMGQDGTYELDEANRPPAHPTEFQDFRRSFAKGTTDEYGQEIDLRSEIKPLDYSSPRAEEPLLELAPERKPKPKYDPETGELIRPMEVQRPVRTARTALPGARPSRRIAVTRLTSIAPLAVSLELLRPMNLLVMGIIFFAHILFVVAAFGVISFPICILLGVMLVAHFGNVIDETGPTSADELPRPLRNVGWHEDIWWPFCTWMLTILYCFGPALAILVSSMPLKVKIACAVVVSAFGIISAPAVLLINATSGSLTNLRPDRVIGTMKAIGGIYPLLLLEMFVAIPIYLLGWMGTVGSAINLMVKLVASTGAVSVSPPAIIDQALVAFPMLVAGIVLMHHFCWMMGQTYRVYHRRFPWTLQGPVRPDEEEDPQGFGVLPPSRHPLNYAGRAPTGPIAAIPLPPLDEDREARLAHVRKSDEERRKASEKMVNDLPNPGDRSGHGGGRGYINF